MLQLPTATVWALIAVPTSISFLDHCKGCRRAWQPLFHVCILDKVSTISSRSAFQFHLPFASCARYSRLATDGAASEACQVDAVSLSGPHFVERQPDFDPLRGAQSDHSAPTTVDTHYTPLAGTSFGWHRKPHRRMSIHHSTSKGAEVDNSVHSNHHCQVCQGFQGCQSLQFIKSVKLVKLV